MIVFILDKLHEDLNGILKKPFIETKDYGDGEEEKGSIECWENYLKRNNSILIELCHG